MKSLEEKIKNLAKETGFDLFSWTSGEDIDPRVLEEKTRKNHITNFESKDLDHRTRPRYHMAGVKTVFVFALSYKWDTKSSGKYEISKYARGRDYHKVMRSKISDFKKKLSKYIDFKYLIQVDTGGLLEKPLAIRAGLGSLGKNTLLLDKDLGSSLFLGLMLTDIQLEYKEYDQEDLCKSCDICLRSCPTGALKGDGTMDPRKCLSYLSQTKDIHPHSKDIKLAYGCDICQDSCPYNKNARANIHEEFKPRIFSFTDDIRNMSNRKFKKLYKDYAFSWIGRKLIVRNMEILDGKYRLCRGTKDSNKNL